MIDADTIILVFGLAALIGFLCLGMWDRPIKLTERVRPLRVNRRAD